MGLHPSYGIGQHWLLRIGSQATYGRTAVSSVRNHLNYCVIFIVHTKFSNTAVGHIVQGSKPQVGDPCPRQSIPRISHTYNTTVKITLHVF